MRFDARAPIQRNDDQLNPSLKVAAIKDRISRKKKNRILENHMLEKKIYTNYYYFTNIIVLVNFLFLYLTGTQ